MAVQVDHVVELVRPQAPDAVREARSERRDRDRHAMHLLDALEAVDALNREPPRRRRRDDDARLADAFAKDRDERLALAAREARPEWERLDNERARDHHVAARGGPPACLLDLRRVDVRERVGGHETVALEERARTLGGRLVGEADLGQQRGRGHRSSFLVERTKRASAGRWKAMPVSV